MATILRQLGATLLLCVAAAAHADTIEVQGVELDPTEARYLLYADFGLELNARLEEALNNGVTLNFVVEFELTRPRWYWFNEKTALEKRESSLSYFPLSQQYRLSNGTQYQSFPTLAEALGVLGRVRGWPVLERNRIENGARYVGSVRMRLDTAQLPKPFQVSAVTNREWSLVSEWKRFSFTPLAPVRDAR